MWDFLTCCALLVFFYKMLGRLIRQHEDDGGEFEQVSQGQFMPWYDPDAVEDPDDE